MVVDETLVPRNARQGKVLVLWPRVNFTLHLQSMLWYRDWCRNQLDGENITTAKHMYIFS